MTQTDPIQTGTGSVGTPASRARLAFAILMLCAFALRLSTIGSKPIWEDEAWTFVTAVAPEGIVAISGNDLHPLSFYAFYSVLPSWLFESDFRFRLPSAIFSCLSVLLAAKFFKLVIADHSLRLWTFALFAMLPLNVRYSYEARAYALAELLSLAVLTAYLLFLQRPSRGRFVALGVMVAFSAHLDGYGLAAPCAVFLHAIFQFRSQPANRRAILAVVIGVLVVVPYYAFRLTHFAAVPEVHSIGESAGLLASFSGRLVELSPFGIGFDQVSKSHRWVIFTFAVIVLGIVLASTRAARALWTNDTRRLLATLLIVTPAVYAVISVTMGVNLIHKKYLIVTIPAFVPLFAAGAMFLARNRRLILFFLLVAVPLAVTIQMLASPGGRADWRTLHERIRNDIQPEDGFAQELQENYERYSFGSLRAYAWRTGDMIAASRLLDYRPAVTRHNAIVKIDDASAWTAGEDSQAIVDFIRSRPNGRVWALSTEWMARGRILDLSAVADRVTTASADGVTATLWRLRTRS